MKHMRRGLRGPEYCLYRSLLLGSASMAAFPVHAAQVELNQIVTLQMRKSEIG